MIRIMSIMKCDFCHGSGQESAGIRQTGANRPAGCQASKSRSRLISAGLAIRRTTDSLRPALRAGVPMDIIL